jgi:hypothetical protein
MDPTPSEAPGPAKFSGEVVYLFAFDIAYEFKNLAPSTLLGAKVEGFTLDASRRAPRSFLVHRPLVAALPERAFEGPLGACRVRTTLKLFLIGAVSIAMRVRFEGETLDSLRRYYGALEGAHSLASEARRLATAVRDELKPFMSRPVEALPEEEAYTVFCFEGPLTSAGGAGLRGEAWLESRRREVAGLLTRESAGRLARQEVIESTGRCLSYYEDDLTVLDWDAALLVDHPAEWEETVHILELANVQLAELEAYDRRLDEGLERSYRDLGPKAARRRADVIRELRELRIDMARFQDELTNITKFFGDWGLARVYEAVAARFHLSDWRRTVDDKLRTLDELHQLLKSDQANRWMMILEVTVVLLFIIDIGFLIAGFKH